MFTALLILFCAQVFLELLATLLNFKNLNQPLPKEFSELYTAEEYQKGLAYQRTQARFSLWSQTIEFAAFLAFWIGGGFPWIYELAGRWFEGDIARGLCFWGVLTLLKQILGLPFALYSTFVIEERFGFNRTTPATFLGDLVKGVVLGLVIGFPLGAAILWFFSTYPESGWLIAWGFLSAVQIVILFVAPKWILPLFNKYTPLPDGELKAQIESLAARLKFPLEGIYLMDGSKRSTKANAFFTGFGKHRRLVLFDTLIEKQTAPELLAVVAHEVGHFKLNHIWRSIAFSFVISFAMFYGLKLFMALPPMFEAFGFTSQNYAIGIVLFSLVLSPVQRMLGIFTHWRSRVHEFEADAYSIGAGNDRESLISSLKKLSKTSFSHLTPHRLRVLLDYTHPPILERIKVMREQ